MKRIVTLLLAAGLVLGAAAGSQAADIKAKGNWTFTWQLGDNNLAKHNGGDKFTAKQRLRTQIDVIASESLKGVLFLEMGDQNWGYAEQGGALGTDGKVVKVRYSYVDWVIPQTDAKVRMGLQNFSLPGFISNNPVLGGGSADGAGITLSGQFTENVGASLFWLRAENDNVGEYYKYDTNGKKIDGSGNAASDAMDFVGLTVPMTFDGVKVTPWGMYGAVGRDSVNSKALNQTLLPVGTQALTGSNVDRHGNAWWVGVASELTYFDPFRVALDAAYGNVDMGSYKASNGKNFDAQRAGWFASILAEYKMDYFTPGVLFWYASGDDANAYNGSERMPTVEGSWTASSYGFDDNFGRDACDMLGLSNDGKMGVYLQAKDISFMEDLTHVFRVGFIKGTNNTEMARQARGLGFNPTNDGVDFGRQVYMTTADKAWEVNFDSQYKIYKDLTLAVELGYINLDLDKGVWGGVADSYRENNVRGAVTLQYVF